MQSYTHDRAPWVFEWDIPWTRQSKVVKRLFASRVQLLYPRNYDIDFVLEDIATNIRQRRQRIRKHMIKNNSKIHTPIQHGPTLRSWNNIWASITNKEYQEKSQKCKAAATARTERMGFTHTLGSVGVALHLNGMRKNSIDFLQTKKLNKRNAWDDVPCLKRFTTSTTRRMGTRFRC